MLAAGCANPINEATWHRYTSAGIEARARGDLAVAEEAHRRALINARIGRLGVEHEAIALHNVASLVERGLPLLEKSAVEQTEPAAFAHILVQYADALRKLNRGADAAAVETRVKALASARTLDMQQKPNRPPFNHPPCR